MDTALTLTLSISVLINILVLRWAYREYVARKRYQQEIRILHQALRGIQPDNQYPLAGFGRLIVWLMIAIFLLEIFRRGF